MRALSYIAYLKESVEPCIYRVVVLESYHFYKIPFLFLNKILVCWSNFSKIRLSLKAEHNSFLERFRY